MLCFESIQELVIECGITFQSLLMTPKNDKFNDNSLTNSNLKTKGGIPSAQTLLHKSGTWIILIPSSFMRQFNWQVLVFVNTTQKSKVVAAKWLDIQDKW